MSSDTLLQPSQAKIGWAGENASRRTIIRSTPKDIAKQLRLCDAKHWEQSERQPGEFAHALRSWFSEWGDLCDESEMGKYFDSNLPSVLFELIQNPRLYVDFEDNPDNVVSLRSPHPIYPRMRPIHRFQTYTIFLLTYLQHLWLVLDDEGRELNRLSRKYRKRMRKLTGPILAVLWEEGCLPRLAQALPLDHIVFSSLIETISCIINCVIAFDDDGW